MLGILVGAGIALLGSVGAPMLNNWINFKREVKREHRQRVRASIRSLQDASLGVAWTLRRHERGSDEVEAAIRDAYMAAHSLDLGLDNWSTLKFTNATIEAMTPEGPSRGELAERMQAVATSAIRLYALADKPEEHEAELTAYKEALRLVLADVGLSSEHGKEDDGPTD